MPPRARRNLLVIAAVMCAVCIVVLVALSSWPTEDAAPPSEPTEAGCPDWPACP